MEVMKIEKGSCVIKDLRNGRSFSYGLQALEHCDVTIINEWERGIIMKASELIKRLQRRIDLYGDLDCVVRYDEGEEEFDLSCVYGDEEAERIVLSDDFDEVINSDD